MADKQRITVKMDINDEVRALLKDLNQMDKDSKGELKEAVKGISAWVAADIKQAATRAPMPEQATKVARTVRAVKDRVPYIVIGGSSVAFSGGAKSGEIVIGNEFGAWPTSTNGMFPNGGRRFPYRSLREGRGNKGYWIFPTVKDKQERIAREWHAACDKVFTAWKNKGV